ncbi:uncharacterized protein LOC112906303 [Agrilus planipennis]|uniref:Uncharacterized protein LOC112906303 n=1 Tax=Agrilus planipennis TaxID=224129 RepID=A0A7F5RJF7_AGRPL|nr:uncharacterized protein LOC112906303 [Agrilus planipennis]
MLAANSAYSLVLYVDDRKDINSLEMIDIVPSSWLTYDDKDDCLKCPCYNKGTKKNIDIFTNAVQNLLSPPASWKLHCVEIHGYANTYASGLKRLETLKVKRFAFTTDDDADEEEKQEKIEKQYRLKGTKDTGKKVEQLLSECQEHFAAKDPINPNETKSKAASARSAKTKKKDNLDDVIIAINELQTVMLDRFNKLSYQIGTLQSEILKQKLEIEEMKKSKSSHLNAPADPSGMFNIEGYATPFKNIHDFEKFDKNLGKSVELRQKVVSIMFLKALLKYTSRQTKVKIITIRQ